MVPSDLRTKRLSPVLYLARIVCLPPCMALSLVPVLIAVTASEILRVSRPTVINRVATFVPIIKPGVKTGTNVRQIRPNKKLLKLKLLKLKLAVAASRQNRDPLVL